MHAGQLLAEKYRIDERLGEGTTGEVWRATDVVTDCAVAVKLLRAELASRGEDQARFIREVRVASALDHPNAVRVLDWGATTDGLFLVMELLIGVTLRARIAAGPLPHADAVAIAGAVAGVLAAAHDLNLVHRDIKPENVFLERTDDGERVRVVDFGLAFICNADDAVGRLTDSGILGGTPAYMSPEQARGAAIGPPSDVYSLGCTLYEMIAGRPPFTGTVGEVITRHAYTGPLPLSLLELSRPAPAPLEELVTAMLAKSPAARPTAAEVGAALASIAATLAPPPG